MTGDLKITCAEKALRLQYEAFMWFSFFESECVFVALMEYNIQNENSDTCCKLATLYPEYQLQFWTPLS